MGSNERTPNTFLPRLARVGWKVGLVAIVAGLLVYRIRFKPVLVNAHVAAAGPIVAEVAGTGTLEARVSSVISPRISGLLTHVLADQGDRVAKGQLLATLHDSDLRQQVEMARADLAATKAGVDRSEAEIASAEASAVEARASFARSEQLLAGKVISAEDFDKAVQRRDVAEAQLTRARLARVELERQALKAEETLRYYQERLSDTRVTSPFDGLVIRRSREPGDVVVPGSQILQVISTDQMWVSAWVDETAISRLAAGQTARVVFRSEPETSYAGVVTRMAPLADRETREFMVDVTVKDLPKAWAVGQRAEVHIQTAAKDEALLVPPQAIAWDKGKPGLFVSNAGHALWHNVTLGLRGEKSVEVVQGVAPGDVVIWSLDPKKAPLKEGRPVKPVEKP